MIPLSDKAISLNSPFKKCYIFSINFLVCGFFTLLVTQQRPNRQNCANAGRLLDSIRDSFVRADAIPLSYHNKPSQSTLETMIYFFTEFA
jgi:hypothetical protein